MTVFTENKSEVFKPYTVSTINIHPWQFHALSQSARCLKDLMVWWLFSPLLCLLCSFSFAIKGLLLNLVHHDFQCCSDFHDSLIWSGVLICEAFAQQYWSVTLCNTMCPSAVVDNSASWAPNNVWCQKNHGTYLLQVKWRYLWLCVLLFYE